MELLVSAAVLSILLSLSYQVLIEGIRVYRESDARLDCQRDAIKVLLFFNQEARETSLSSVRAVQDTGAQYPGCVMGSARNLRGVLTVNASGAAVWGKWICYVRNGSKLMRYESLNTAAGPQTVPLPPTQTPDSFVTAPPIHRRQLSQFVKKFNITPTTGTGGVRSIAIELEMSALNGAVSTLIRNSAFPNP